MTPKNVNVIGLKLMRFYSGCLSGCNNSRFPVNICKADSILQTQSDSPCPLPAVKYSTAGKYQPSSLTLTPGVFNATQERVTLGGDTTQMFLKTTSKHWNQYKSRKVKQSNIIRNIYWCMCLLMSDSPFCQIEMADPPALHSLLCS